MPKIKAITDPAFRTGEGAKGPWSLMQVQTDDGRTATIFAPATVGDEVTLTYDEKYKNYSAKKVKPNLSTPAPSNDALERIEKKLDQILFKINGIKAQVNGADAVPESLPMDTELPPMENYNEPPF